MDFTFTEDQLLFAESIKDFLRLWRRNKDHLLATSLMLETNVVVNKKRRGVNLSFIFLLVLFANLMNISI